MGGVKEGWQFRTLHEGGISEPYSKDRLNEFIAGNQCYCLSFTKATAPALEDCTKAVETQATSNGKVEVAEESEAEKEKQMSPQPQQALDVATPAAENLNTKGTEVPAPIEATAKCEDWKTPVVAEQAVTVTAPVELKGMCGFGCCG